ncbi:uncharacterized protein EV154DRAFT_528370 [Mucor mucedo]|uniref:uncharacterized protein n=1 Tax=Mucor mucedo TaxID=29922 RepID=UPI00221F2B9C|nr:uncharacterized protein EV154DRAFT_528370 [Mucor mucedo]KAI7873292.1 hypothetical protein EV154DRAFT_528370 [Mucor mucedo]
MRVVLFFTNNLAEPENIYFDLHFREPTYTIMHKIHFPNPSPELIHLLSIELPSSDILINHNDHIKKRRTSPSLTTNNTSKKIKTPPTMPSPAQFSDGPLTPSSYHNKYPSSPAAFNPQSFDTDLFTHSFDSNHHDLFRAVHGYKHTTDDGHIIDDIYAEKDLENANPIHTKHLEDNVRIAWGIPEGLDMLELAKRLCAGSSEQTEEIEALIKAHKKDGIQLQENEDEFVVDLYSLGPDLLSQLWDYTEKKKMSSSRTVLSPFSLVQANTMMIEDE